MTKRKGDLKNYFMTFKIKKLILDMKLQMYFCLEGLVLAIKSDGVMEIFLCLCKQ